jgi:hypothetical protein
VITLLSDRFAPTTSRFGFLEVPLEEAARELLVGTAGGRCGRPLADAVVR